MFMIMGPGRSGSSLLKSMLNANSKIWLPQEIFFFNSLLPRLQVTFGVQPVFHDIQKYCEFVEEQWWMRGVKANVLKAVSYTHLTLPTKA